jgi:hypothetical protein
MRLLKAFLFGFVLAPFFFAVFFGYMTWPVFLFSDTNVWLYWALFNIMAFLSFLFYMDGGNK